MNQWRTEEHKLIHKSKICNTYQNLEKQKEDQAHWMHSVPLRKLFPSSIRGLIWNMSSQDRMISITSVLIPKTLVSASHSTIVKYTNKICAEEEEIQKFRKLKVWRITGIYNQEALVPKGCNLSETTQPFQKVCNL